MRLSRLSPGAGTSVPLCGVLPLRRPGRLPPAGPRWVCFGLLPAGRPHPSGWVSLPLATVCDPAPSSLLPSWLFSSRPPLTSVSLLLSRLAPSQLSWLHTAGGWEARLPPCAPPRSRTLPAGSPHVITWRPLPPEGAWCPPPLPPGAAAGSAVAWGPGEAAGQWGLQGWPSRPGPWRLLNSLLPRDSPVSAWHPQLSRLPGDIWAMAPSNLLLTSSVNVPTLPLSPPGDPSVRPSQWLLPQRQGPPPPPYSTIP